MRLYFLTLLTTVVVILAITGGGRESIAFLAKEPLSGPQGEVFNTFLWVFWASALAIIVTMSYVARLLRPRSRGGGAQTKKSAPGS